jgi:hypothetical protein
MNTTIQNISSIDPNFTTITGNLTVSNQLKTPLISDELLTSSIALTTGGINLTSDALNFNSHSVLSATGTGTQYFMGDGSLLQYSANSGNSNFYLYKSNSIAGPPPANGFVYYNDNPQGMATTLFISHLTADSIDIEVFFNNLNQINDVYLQDRSNSNNFIRYNITGTPTIFIGSHIQIPVIKIVSSGTGESSFGINHDILLSFFTNNIEVDTRLSSLETKTQNMDSVLNQTGINGNLTVYGTNGVIAQRFFRVGGVGGEFLKANGTVDSNTYSKIQAYNVPVQVSGTTETSLSANVLKGSWTWADSAIGSLKIIRVIGTYTRSTNISNTFTFRIKAGGLTVITFITAPSPNTTAIPTPFLTYELQLELRRVSNTQIEMTSKYENIETQQNPNVANRNYNSASSPTVPVPAIGVSTLWSLTAQGSVSASTLFGTAVVTSIMD